MYNDLTVLENLEMGRQPPRPGRRPWSPERLFALFPNLAERQKTPAGRLSGGEQQMLAIARALMGNPLALLLDEPTEGLAPRLVRTIAETIAGLRNQGLAILLAEQSLTLAGTIADRAYIMEKGEIRHHVPMDAVRADPTLLRTWLAV